MKHLAAITCFGSLMLLGTDVVLGHCDTMNGPVVTAAQKALESGKVDLVLIWVQKDDEAVIKEAFTKTLAVRKLGPEAQRLADMYFFETLVRVHRAGEGVGYTGLKPSTTPLDPGIEAADRALEKGSAEELLKHLHEAVHTGIHKHFTSAMATQDFRPGDIEAGRQYVKAYVEFIHYAERLFQAASAAPEGHLRESEQGSPQGHKH